MSRPSFNAGTRPLAQDYIDAFPLIALMTADQTVTNSTVLVDAAGLSVTLTSATYYSIRGVLFFEAAAANDMKVGRGGTATYTDMKWTLQSITSGATNGSWGSAVSNSAAATWVAEGQGAAQWALATIEAYCLVNAGGTFTVQFAENTAGVGTTAILGAGSRLEVVKLA